MKEKKTPDIERVFAALALIISQRGSGIVKVKEILTAEQQQKAG